MDEITAARNAELVAIKTILGLLLGKSLAQDGSTAEYLDRMRKSYLEISAVAYEEKLSQALEAGPAIAYRDALASTFDTIFKHAIASYEMHRHDNVAAPAAEVKSD